MTFMANGRSGQSKDDSIIEARSYVDLYLRMDWYDRLSELQHGLLCLCEDGQYLTSMFVLSL